MVDARGSGMTQENRVMVSAARKTNGYSPIKEILEKEDEYWTDIRPAV
jgi:hypothetical protein